MVNIYQLKLPTRLPDADRAVLTAQVSPARQARIKRQKNCRQQLLTLYGEALLRYLLVTRHRLAPDRLQWAYGPHGKPGLAAYPQMHFNLSHSADRLLLGISDEGPLGVDIEIRENVPYRLMRRHFHPREIAYVEAGPEPQRRLRFLAVWTRKEAYLKLTGAGLTTPLAELDTRQLPVFLETYPVPGGLAAICLQTPPTAMRTEEITPETLQQYFANLA